MHDDHLIDVTLPTRRHLPHAPPPWSDGAVCYLLTICCRERHRNELCRPERADAIRRTLHFHHECARWRLHACVLMPDHLHLLVTMSVQSDVRHLVFHWKRYIARLHGVAWQRDFFEHRLRRHEHFEVKREYLRQNPVRAGLVVHAEEWPYFWEW